MGVFRALHLAQLAGARREPPNAGRRPPPCCCRGAIFIYLFFYFFFGVGCPTVYGFLSYCVGRFGRLIAAVLSLNYYLFLWVLAFIVGPVIIVIRVISKPTQRPPLPKGIAVTYAALQGRPLTPDRWRGH